MSKDIAGLLEGLNLSELRQLSMLVHWRSMDIAAEERRRSTVDVTRGEFEDLAKQVRGQV